MTAAAGNLLSGIAARRDEEMMPLATTPHVRIERIVSHGHASPPGFWYDQDWSEWVLVVSGEAGLQIAGETAPRVLKPGDYVAIPAHMRHRVDWTAPGEPTVWLAVHYE